MPEYIKPTVDTKFHIDFDWWQQQKRSLRVHLMSHLCSECRAQYADQPPQEIDWIDPYTAEVKRVDIMWEAVRTCCESRADYITPQSPFTAAVFRTFVANDNTPLTPAEMQQTLSWKSGAAILRIIGGHEVYYGIRPIPGSKK